MFKIIDYAGETVKTISGSQLQHMPGIWIFMWILFRNDDESYKRRRNR